jgi:uncharacterized protein (DUF983 family)
MVFGKGSKLYSVLGFKCPRCHEGELFPNRSLIISKNAFEMAERCDKCGQPYFPEPGFYYGAMFINYILTGWFCVLFALLFVFGFSWSVNATFLALIPVCLVLFVWSFRLARAIWINIVVKYDREAIKNPIHDHKSYAN